MIISFIRCIPHLLLYYIHHNKLLIRSDIDRWKKIKNIKYKKPIDFIYLMTFFHEYRNVFYVRAGFISHFLNPLCPKIRTLRINTKKIGEGLFISHGYSTGISAVSIGKNCSIYHNVSIGNYNGFPTILDNVTVYPGAAVIGKITIGNNTIIGANATVCENIQGNCTIFPATSRVIKWNNDNKPADSIK